MRCGCAILTGASIGSVFSDWALWASFTLWPRFTPCSSVALWACRPSIALHALRPLRPCLAFKVLKCKRKSSRALSPAHRHSDGRCTGVGIYSSCRSSNRCICANRSGGAFWPLRAGVSLGSLWAHLSPAWFPGVCITKIPVSIVANGGGDAVLAVCTLRQRKFAPRVFPRVRIPELPASVISGYWRVGDNLPHPGLHLAKLAGHRGPLAGT